MKKILAAAALVALLACGGEEDPRSGLAPLPALDLSGAEAGARAQIDAERAEVERVGADAGATPAELAQAYADLGLVYLTYELLDAAGTCFANARLLAPDDFRWHYLAGYLEGLQGRLPRAAELYGRALELEPDFLPAVVRLGRIRLEQGDLEAARRSFERALELDPGAAAAHEGLGKVAAAAGDAEEAVRRFERALELDPAASGLRYALGQTYRDLGRLDEARAELARAGDVAARVPDPLIRPLADLAESSQFYLVQGAEAIDDEDYAAAAAAFRAARARDPASLAAARGLAVSLERLGDAEGARETVEETLARADTQTGEASERAALHLLLGDLRARGGDGAGALEAYLRAAEIEPADPQAHLRAADALARRGRFDEAVERYGRLLELAPAWAPAVYEKRATVHVNLGRREAAVADFRRAVEARPEDPGLRSRFAAALEHLGDAEGARRERREAERLRGAAAAEPALLAEEARRLTAAGEHEAAVELLRRAAELVPEDLEIRYRLAALLGHLGRYGEAVEHFERVLADAPRSVPAHRGRAVALVLAGRHGEARVALQEALKTFPRHAGFALTQVHLLATTPDAGVRDGRLALEIARRVAAERRDPVARQALALALAAAGDHDAAAELQRRLVAEAPSAHASARLAAFERREPWPAQSNDEILAALGPPK